MISAINTELFMISAIDTESFMISAIDTESFMHMISATLFTRLEPALWMQVAGWWVLATTGCQMPAVMTISLGQRNHVTLIVK